MSMGYCVRRVFIAGACVLWAANAGAAIAQDAVEQFYKGKSINMIVGSSAGGGYDTYARLLARYLSANVPGNPAIVPQNMSGAGSNRAAGFIYGVAPKDGTAIGAIFPGAIFQPLLGETQVTHDASKFNYLGNANTDAYICVARADAPVKTFEDALTKELIIGASGEGATTRDLPAVMNGVLGTKFKIVTGYPGSREITLAIERGEVQGACGIGWTGITNFYPDWFSRGFVKVIAQISVTGHPEMTKQGIPLATSFAKTDEDRQVLEMMFSQGQFGRPFVLPPGVPTDRLSALRKGFMTAMRDKNLLAEADKMKLDVEPTSGEEMQALAAKLYATPRRVIERAKAALAAKPQR